MSEVFDYLLKVVVVGDGGVGKTAIAVRFAEGVFKEDYKMTVGVDFSIRTIDVPMPNDEIRKIKFQIWDLGGQERFSYTRPLYYRGAVGGMVVYDLTDRLSFEHLEKWFGEVEKSCVSVPLLLIGNKADLPGRQVSREEGEELARAKKCTYYESSAKTGQSITAIFEKLGRIIIMKEEGLVEQEVESADQKRHKEYIEKYMSLAVSANTAITEYRYQEALKLLKEAYKYAREIGYEDGKKWIEDQTQAILQILRQQVLE